MNPCLENHWKIRSTKQINKKTCDPENKRFTLESRKEIEEIFRMMEEAEIRGVSCAPGTEGNLPRFKQVRKH